MNPRLLPRSSSARAAVASIGSVVMLGLTGPGVHGWPFALVALVPLILLANPTRPSESRATEAHATEPHAMGEPMGRWKRIVYLVFVVYYLMSLQGLRHAHPLMFLPLTAMAAYLAIYPLLFVVLLRRTPGLVAAVVFWVGGEWVRNYFATGISVMMLGHTVVDMPGGGLIQIADLQGSYGVSLLLVVINYAVADAILRWRNQPSGWKISASAAIAMTVAALVYASVSKQHRLVESDTRVLLVGRDEQTEYMQDPQREQEIWQQYAAQTIKAVADAGAPIAAVVWPESMFSGGQPWLVAEDDLIVPEDAGGEKFEFNEDDFRSIIGETQRQFINRNVNLQRALRNSGSTGATADVPAPAIIGGCGMVRYGATARQYSGILHVAPDGRVVDTYHKNHLVMFGEYIPWIKSIPGLRDFVPPGLGLDAGDGPSMFEIGRLKILPNLCIETAVERIAVNHLHERPDANVIVTLTNDAWFDHSAVVSHHLRCAQMVAVGTRRPILSSANGGPTAWIDSFGRIVEKIPLNESGTILAAPKLDSRETLYVKLGSWPTAVLGWLFIGAVCRVCIQSRRSPPR